jgi:hypothetical protein
LLVHNELSFADEVSTALVAMGYDIVVLSDPMPATTALETSPWPDLLITRVLYGEGRLNGIALACMAHAKCPGIKVVVIGSPEYAEMTDGIGEFLAYPVAIPRGPACRHSIAR